MQLVRVGGVVVDDDDDDDFVFLAAASLLSLLVDAEFDVELEVLVGVPLPPSALLLLLPVLSQTISKGLGKEEAEEVLESCECLFGVMLAGVRTCTEAFALAAVIWLLLLLVWNGGFGMERNELRVLRLRPRSYCTFVCACDVGDERRNRRRTWLDVKDLDSINRFAAGWWLAFVAR